MNSADEAKTAVLNFGRLTEKLLEFSAITCSVVISVIFLRVLGRIIRFRPEVLVWSISHDSFADSTSPQSV